MAHDHAVEMTAVDVDKSRRLLFATLLTAGIFVAEVVGGWLSGSLALLSDAAHVFADVFSLALSFVALRLACRVPTSTRTYGFHRAEIFAAVINGLTLLVIAGLIWHEAWQRLWAPPEIKTTQMLVIAAAGLAANWLVLTRLSGHHHDLNLQSAYLHVLGDLVASFGVVVAALIMSFTGWYLADPIISALIGLLIVLSGWRLVDEAMHILLLGVPRHLKLEKIAEAMKEVPDVLGVHNLRLWAACSNVYVLSAHVVACPETEEGRVRVREALRHLLMEEYGVSEVTLELECEPTGHEALVGPLAHPERVAGDQGHDHDHTH